MEVKHTHYTLHLSRSLPNLSPSSSIRCSRFNPWINTKISINKRFQGLAELWRFHVLQMLKPEIQTPNKNHHSSHHHVIKGAQNLNSILRQYGVSIDLIGTGDKNTTDFDDLLLKYQLLNTLAFAREHNRLIKRNAFPSLHQVGLGSSFHGNLEEKPLMIQTPHASPHAKSNGYFLVLIPLITLCITCIIQAFSTRVPKENRSNALDESKMLLSKAKSSRWKHALSYNNETDDIVSILPSAPDNEEDENLFENSYSKVENDYQKFLSECGISESGYQHRRGGTH